MICSSKLEESKMHFNTFKLGSFLMDLFIRRETFVKVLLPNIILRLELVSLFVEMTQF